MDIFISNLIEEPETDSHAKHKRMDKNKELKKTLEAIKRLKISSTLSSSSSQFSMIVISKASQPACQPSSRSLDLDHIMSNKTKKNRNKNSNNKKQINKK